MSCIILASPAVSLVLHAAGNTPALPAAQDISGNATTIVALLGQYRIDLDQSTEYLTPLYYAVIKPDTNLVQALLEAGAKPSVATAEGRLPIVEAISDGSTLSLLGLHT